MNDRLNNLGDERSDAFLLDAWRAGDHGSGQLLLSRYRPRVLRYFIGRKGAPPNLADDLTHDTLIACATSICRFKKNSRFSTYIFGIANIKYFEHLRASERHKALSFDTIEPELEATASSCPHSRLERIDDFEQIRGALAELDHHNRQVIELVYWHSLSTREISELLEVPVGTIRARLSRSLKYLRTLLVSTVGSSPSRQSSAPPSPARALPGANTEHYPRAAGDERTLHAANSEEYGAPSAQALRNVTN